MANQCDVILLAAGRGERLGEKLPKAAVRLAGLPLFIHSLRAFRAHPDVERIVLVVPPEPEAGAKLRDLMSDESYGAKYLVVPGGVRRQDSAWAGLLALREAGRDLDRIVLIHDAARPLVNDALISSCLENMRRPFEDVDQDHLPGILATGIWGTGPAGVVPGLPVRETLKLVFEDRVILTQPRDHLFMAQTPQAFRLGPLLEVHRKAHDLGLLATDDAALLEWQGIPVRLIPGDSVNLKVTFPEDLVLAEQLLVQRRETGVVQPKSPAGASSGTPRGSDP